MFGLQKDQHSPTGLPEHLHHSAAEARTAKEPVMTPSHPIIREALGRPGIRNP
jgi:hypothetical protein